MTVTPATNHLPSLKFNQPLPLHTAFLAKMTEHVFYLHIQSSLSKPTVLTTAGTWWKMGGEASIQEIWIWFHQVVGKEQRPRLHTARFRTNTRPLNTTRSILFHPLPLWLSFHSPTPYVNGSIKPHYLMQVLPIRSHGQSQVICFRLVLN